MALSVLSVVVLTAKILVIDKVRTAACIIQILLQSHGVNLIEGFIVLTLYVSDRDGSRRATSSIMLVLFLNDVELLSTQCSISRALLNASRIQISFILVLAFSILRIL